MTAGATPGVLHHRPLRSIAAPAEHSIVSPRPSRRFPSLSPAPLPFSVPAAIKGMHQPLEFPPPLLPSAIFLLPAQAPSATHQVPEELCSQILSQFSPSHPAACSSALRKSLLVICKKHRRRRSTAGLSRCSSFGRSTQACFFSTPSFPFRKKVSCRPQSASPDPSYPPDPGSVSPDPVCSADPYPPRPRARL
uniref:Uncharacterized protein n=1 Tax=Setaria viridis TaxID=4556 RepID=A0A4U6TNQ5_SETVI|nr:hypothetical protein SEVIR_7G045505v2 [Setaria viridis]